MVEAQNETRTCWKWVVKIPQRQTQCWANKMIFVIIVLVEGLAAWGDHMLQPSLPAAVSFSFHLHILFFLLFLHDTFRALGIRTAIKGRQLILQKFSSENSVIAYMNWLFLTNYTYCSPTGPPTCWLQAHYNETLVSWVMSKLLVWLCTIYSGCVHLQHTDSCLFILMWLIMLSSSPSREKGTFYCQQRGFWFGAVAFVLHNKEAYQDVFEIICLKSKFSSELVCLLSSLASFCIIN